MAHFMEWCLLQDLMAYGYDENGNTKGEPQVKIQPERLKWDIPEAAVVGFGFFVNLDENLIR